MEVGKNSENEQTSIQIQMPDVTGITVKGAKQLLTELGLEYEIDTDNLDAIITEQLPKKGIGINQGTKVFLYSY